MSAHPPALRADRERFLAKADALVQQHHRDDTTLGLLVVTLKRLREINAAFGYGAGDEAFAESQRRLEAALRPDDYVEQISQQDFGVLLPNLRGREHARLAAGNITRALAEPIQTDDSTFRLHPRVGLALLPNDGTDANALLARANDALVRGRSLPHFPDVLEPAVWLEPPKVVLEEALRAALEADAIRLYYQPILDLKQGRVSGAEALVRWEHPQYGSLAPDTFVPLAESSGLIKPLTERVITAGLRQLAEWKPQWPKAALSLNLSPRNLREEDLAELLGSLIRLWGVDANDLTLELTEGALMEDPPHGQRLLEAIHSAGARIAIDDFGTGYSGLIYLKDLPMHRIKIDKSFVIHLTSDVASARIIRAVINLAHDFGLEVVAEGVTDEETLKRLRELGCDHAQGFYIAPAMSSDEFIEWVNTAQRR